MQNNLSARRRALMETTVGETWDFQWDYSKGKLEDQPGWEKVVSGSASSTMTSDGERFSTAGSHSDYCIVRPQSSSPLRTMTGGLGIMEVTFFGNIATGINENFEIRVVESASKRISTAITGTQGRLNITVQDRNETIICPFESNIVYTVRVEMKASGADVYVNGVIKLSDFSLSASLYGAYNGVLAIGLGNNSLTLKALKIKAGRT